jgi:hypothetical protein
MWFAAKIINISEAAIKNYSKTVVKAKMTAGD